MKMIPNRMLESEKTHHLAGNIIANMIYTRFKQRPLTKIIIADSLFSMVFSYYLPSYILRDWYKELQ